MSYANNIETRKAITTENKSGLLIQLKKHDPKVLLRPNVQSRLIQDHSMMLFQQLVMKEAKAALRAKQLQVFKNALSVEIEITSIQAPITLHLEKVLKAIFDSLNKNVIDDDYLIENAQVWLIKGQKRNPKTNIKITIYDNVTKEGITFYCSLPCVEKKDAVVYDIGGSLHRHPQSTVEHKMIEQAIGSSSLQSGRQYDICHMMFCTSNKNKDVDNMFLAYIDVIRQKGLLNTTNNIGIGMYKRRVDKGNESVIINLLSK